MKILVVDDEPKVRDVLRIIVEQQGHTVIEAGDGQEGFAAAVKHKPDAIISDGLMPKMDGFQLLRAIRRDETLGSIPFVIHSAIYTEDKERELALLLGADALIAKPKYPSDFWREFTAALDAHASKQRQAVQARAIQQEDEELKDYSQMVASKLETKVQELEATIADLEWTKKVLQESEERYRQLFENNPHPMWAFDLETLAFLAVNEAAVLKYGYSREEFLIMTIKDIRPAKEVPLLLDKLSRTTEGFDIAGIWTHRKKDGTIITVEITSHSLDFGGRRANLVLAIDVTERRRMEKAIRDASDEWRNTFDAMSDAVSLLDRDGKILRCNKAMADLVGKNYQEIIGRQCRELVRVTSGTVIDCPYEIMKRSRKRETLVAQLDDRWFEVSANPFFDTEGNLFGAVHIMSDFTARKRLEDALKAAVVRAEDEKARADSIVEAVGDGITIQDKNFRILYQNEAFKKLIGDHIGELCYMAYERNEQRCEGCGVAQVFKDGGTHVVERSAPTDKGVIYVEITASPLRDSTGNIVAGIEVIHNVTARKQAEVALASKQYFLSEAQRIAHIGSWEVDAVTGKVAGSDELYRIFGVSPDLFEHTVGGFIEYIHPDDQESIRVWTEAILSGMKVMEQDFRIIWPNSEIRYIRLAGESFTDETEKPVRAMGTAQDITERRRAEGVLRASEEMHRRIFQNSPVGIFHYDNDLVITECNDRFVKILRSKREKLISLEMHTLKDQRVLPSLETAIKGEEGRYEGGYRATTSSAEIWVSMSTAPLFDDKQMVNGGIGIVEDITERKQAEAAIEHQKQFTEDLIQNSAIATFVLDTRHNVLIWNKACEVLTGLTASDMLGRNLAWKPFYAERRPVMADVILDQDAKNLSSLYADYSKSVLTPEGLHAERWFENLNGKKRYIVFDAAPIRDSAGNIIAAIETLQDFTDRKKLEDQIIQAQQEWEETFNTITDMVTVHDKDFNIIHANKAAEKILGLSFLEVKKAKCYEHYHGTSRPPDGCPSCQSLVTGEPSTTELFEPHLNMFIEIRAIPRLNSGGQLEGLIHVVRDISERKRSEDVLREERNKAQTYLDIAGVLIVALDAEGQVVLINKKGLEITGYEEQEIIGLNWFDLCLPGRIREEVRGVFHKMVAGTISLVEYYENSIVTKKGVERIMAFHNVILRSEAGEMAGVLSSGEDITEQKWAHDQLNQRVHQAALGAEIGDALTRGGDLRTTLQLCTDAIVKHLDAAFARIWTLNEKDQVLEMQASAGMYTHINGAHGRVPVGKFKIGIIAEDRKPHLTNQVIGDPHVGDQEWAKKEGMVAFAGYPLIVQDKLVGVMAMFSRKKIMEAMMSSLASMADVIALGIERKRTEDALQQYSKQLTALNIASNTLMIITNLNDLYDSICEIIYGVFDFQLAWLGIVEPDTYMVKPVAYSGLAGDYLTNIKVTWDDSPYGKGPTGMAIKTKKSSTMRVTDPDFTPWTEDARRRGYVASLAVPLVYARDKCIGALNFYSDDAGYFTPDRIKLCEIFANQAAIAIENAHLIEGLETSVQERTAELQGTNIYLQTVNKELELRRVEAVAGSRSKSDFLANMSHELRTPLNAVIGLSQVLLEQTFGPLNAKQSEYLEGVRQSGDHLLSLINEILDLSKIEAGKEQFEPAVFSMLDTLRNAFMFVKEKAMKHGIVLSQEIGPEVGLFYADERRIKQILFNLLSNAVKFTEPGGKVGLKACQDEHAFTLTVWDTGIGIPENKRHLIFQPFQQLDGSLSRKHEGTGLGLVLSKRLVEMHGGTIIFESRQGGGTIFTVSLPVRSDKQRGTQTHIPQSEEFPQRTGGLTAGKRIMIVEDNHLNMLLVADFLRGKAFEVVEAATGEAALEKASQERPDIILLDIQMPGIDGFEVIRRLRENDALKGIPVIAMTALAMKGDEERCMRSGFNDYISKPVNLHEVLRKIDRSLGRGSTHER